MPRQLASTLGAVRRGAESGGALARVSGLVLPASAGRVSPDSCDSEGADVAAGAGASGRAIGCVGCAGDAAGGVAAPFSTGAGSTRGERGAGDSGTGLRDSGFFFTRATGGSTRSGSCRGAGGASAAGSSPGGGGGGSARGGCTGAEGGSTGGSREGAGVGSTDGGSAGGGEGAGDASGAAAAGAMGIDGVFPERTVGGCATSAAGEGSGAGAAGDASISATSIGRTLSGRGVLAKPSTPAITAACRATAHAAAASLDKSIVRL
ncbi:MAG TPA: hypothetical protein VGE10_09740 [Zeimonas sp.]